MIFSIQVDFVTMQEAYPPENTLLMLVLKAKPYDVEKVAEVAYLYKKSRFTGSSPEFQPASSSTNEDGSRVISSSTSDHSAIKPSDVFAWAIWPAAVKAI
jgi:hypothetical protein